MATSCSVCYWHWVGAGLLAMSGAIASSGDCVLAQVTPDGTLGVESSVVTLTNVNGIPSEQIDGGATRGANLFHSFEQFSVPTGGEANFNNALDIQNIISRVTGSSISNIDGLLRANGAANLFLLNPNGINFGPNARLSIGGSFVGSTASSLNFADGTQFSATAPQATPLLTVSVPIGLQFGPQAGGLRVQGPGAVRDRNRNYQLVNREAGLFVQANETLALVGSGVALEGGILKTDGGRIELGSVVGLGLVSLTLIDSGWALGYSGVPTFENIQLSLVSAVDASGAGGGDVQVQGRRVTLTNGSYIEATTLGSEPGGTLSVTAVDAIELIGTTADGQIPSVLYTGTRAEGDAGDLTIATGRLLVRDGAVVSTFTAGTGTGGTLSVTAADAIELIGRSVYGAPSGLFASTAGEGDSGNLTVETGRLIVQDGAGVVASTFGEGSAGILAISARESVEVSGTSSVSVSSRGSGDAGNLEVAARSIRLDNESALSANTTAGQGNIILRSEYLVLRRGSNITTNATGTATGGNITIDTDVLAALENSDITADADEASGGRIRTSATGIFGTQFRTQPTPESDITASSNLGPEFSGTVEINNPDVDPSQGLVELPAEVVDVSNQIAQGCSAGVRSGETKFVITGRGGLPPNPKDPLTGDNVLTEWNTLGSDTENRSSAEEGATNPAQESTPTTIVEASGWMTNDKGEVILTATAPTATLNIPWVPKSNCNAPEPNS